MMSTDTVEQPSAHDEHTGKDASTVFLAVKNFVNFGRETAYCNCWAPVERVFFASKFHCEPFSSLN